MQRGHEGAVKAVCIHLLMVWANTRAPSCHAASSYCSDLPRVQSCCRVGVRGPVRFLSGPSAAAASSALPTEPPGVPTSSVQPIRGQKHAYACCLSSPQKTCLSRRLTSCCLRRLLTTSSFFKMASLTLAKQKNRVTKIHSTRLCTDAAYFSC